MNLEYEARRALADLKGYLASDEGRRVRNALAAGMIAAAPLLTRIPIFRSTLIGRLAGGAGAATLLVKGAQMLREWEPKEVRA